MNITDIIKRVQRVFGDESEVQVTEDDVLRWVNDAQTEAVSQHSGLLQTEGFIDAIENVSDYTLPTDLFTLSHAFYLSSGTYYALRFMSLLAFNEYIDGWSGDTYATGVPLVFTRTLADKITIFPKPNEALVAGLKLIYSRYPVAVVDSSSALDLPEYYHLYILNYCLMNAYEMDEDWEAVDKKTAIVQSTLNFMNGRESWFGQEKYPSVMPVIEDYI